MKLMWGRKAADERGAVLIISVVGVVLAVVAAALAVDLGSLAQEKRSDQKVADLASLDAVRGLNDSYILGLGRLDLTVLTPKLLRATTVARESALRNGYDPADGSRGHDLQVVLGVRDNGQPKNFRQTCPPLAGIPECINVNAVKVSISSTVPYGFTSGSGRVTVSAVAFQDTLVPPPVTTTTTVPPGPTTTVPPLPETASFSIGSSLVNLSTSSSTLLNPIVGQMIDGGVALSLASWQGLASGNVTLGALQAELADLGISVGSVSQLLNAELTLAKLYQATANALTQGGDTANANVLNILRAAAKVTATVRLGELVKVQTGTDDAAVLGTSLNLLQLVTGSAEVANGTNAVSVSNVGITVPGATRTDLTLKVTELPKIYIGPEGGSVTTGQVDLSVTTTVSLDVSVPGTLGVNLLRVTGPLPVGIQLAGAKGTLTSINCSASKGIVVTADPKAFNGAAEVTSLRVSTLLGLPVLDVETTTATPSVDGPPVPLSFSYPSQFTPPASPPFSKHAGSQPVGLQGLTTTSPGNVTVLGLLPLGTTTADIVTAVMDALAPVIGNVDSSVLTPLLTALGLDVGGADVTALGLNCPITAPPVSTTTTVPPPPTTTTTTLPPPAAPPALIG